MEMNSYESHGREEKLMKCATCGIDNLAEASFCNKCGNSLSGYVAGDPTLQGMVSFPDAVKLGFQRYFDFTGRSTRAEYWWWALFQGIALTAVTVIDVLIDTYPIFYAIFTLGLFIPYLAVTVRRFHDTNKSAWWMLLSLVPFGAIVLIVFLFQGSDKGTNKYGPNL